jgi:hypothetical protein
LESTCASGQKLQSEAWGAQQFSQSPGPSGGKASEGAAGLDRILHDDEPTQCQNIPREEHFNCPGQHGTSAFVASRNLRDTSNPHLKIAEVGRS